MKRRKVLRHLVEILVGTDVAVSSLYPEKGSGDKNLFNFYLDEHSMINICIEKEVIY